MLRAPFAVRAVDFVCLMGRTLQETPLTKSELIESVAGQSPERTKKDIEGAVNAIFRSMSEALARGERIEIRGLGSFRVKERMARVGRNPKTGEVVAIPSRKVPYFTVGKQLKARVDALN